MNVAKRLRVRIPLDFPDVWRPNVTRCLEFLKPRDVLNVSGVALILFAWKLPEVLKYLNVLYDVIAMGGAVGYN